MTFAAFGSLMSILTLYAFNPLQSGSNAGLLTPTQPTASTSTTGWTVATASINYSRMSYNVERASSTFNPPQEPSGAPTSQAPDCFRISAATTGDFSAGTWYSSLSVIAVTAGTTHDGRALFRIWRASSSSAVSPTEITSSIMTGTLIANLTTTVAQSSAASIQVGAFSLSNEYLFLQCAWQRTGAGGSSTNDVLLRYGSMGQTNGTGLITTDFSTGGGGAAPIAGMMMPYYAAVVQDSV